MADGIKEVVDNEAQGVALLTQSVATLTAAVETMNDVLLVLVHNAKKQGLEIPEWDSVEAVEKDVSEEVRKCVNAIRKVYGPDTTNQG